MTVKELKEKLKSAPDCAVVKLELPYDPFRNGSDFADISVKVEDGCSFKEDRVYIKEV